MESLSTLKLEQKKFKAKKQEKSRYLLKIANAAEKPVKLKVPSFFSQQLKKQSVLIFIVEELKLIFKNIVLIILNVTFDEETLFLHVE